MAGRRFEPNPDCGRRHEHRGLQHRPEKLHAREWKSSHDFLGQLWIETKDQLTINIQLFQSNGQLQELYLLVIDSKARAARPPMEWVEVSRKAVSG
jgi:hypothetical protein